MNIFEMNSGVQEQKEEESTEMTELGTSLGSLIEKDSSIEVGKSTFDLLKLLLYQNEILSHIHIVAISPEEEPNTGGYFKIVRSKGDYVPTVFIVREDENHMHELKNSREASARRVAQLLGIDFDVLTPHTLRLFIVTHEMGHALDYVKNYETNPQYATESGDEWISQYESILSTLPVPDFDPVDLKEEIGMFGGLEDFIQAYPEIQKVVQQNNIGSLKDLVDLQETAYRNSAYESYADNFATHFLITNAQKLGIDEIN